MEIYEYYFEDYKQKYSVFTTWILDDEAIINIASSIFKYQLIIFDKFPLSNPVPTYDDLPEQLIDYIKEDSDLELISVLDKDLKETFVVRQLVTVIKVQQILFDEVEECIYT